MIDENGVLPRPRRLLHWPVYTMGQVYRPAYDRLDSELTEAGLSIRLYQVLLCLDEFGGLSQQQICQAVKVDRSEMVRLVDRLEEAGFAKRTPDKADRRRHLVKISASGQEALARTTALVDQINDQVLAAITEDERQIMHRILLGVLGEDRDLAP